MKEMYNAIANGLGPELTVNINLLSIAIQIADASVLSDATNYCNHRNRRDCRNCIVGETENTLAGIR